MPTEGKTPTEEGTTPIKRICWDSCVFIHRIQRTRGKIAILEQITLRCGTRRHHLCYLGALHCGSRKAGPRKAINGEAREGNRRVLSERLH